MVTLPGDVDGDKDVDIFDIVNIAGVYGPSQADPSYDPNARASMVTATSTSSTSWLEQDAAEKAGNPAHANILQS
jgi:hypothetical protein